MAPYNLSRQRLASVKSLLEQDKGKHTLELINSLPIGICLTDQNGYFEDVNEAYCTLYGFTHDELVGRHFTEMVVPEEQRNELVEAHDSFIKEKSELSDVWQVQKKSGERMYILANAVHLELEGASKKLTLVVDVSDLKKTEKRLSSTIETLENTLRTQEDATSMTLHDLRKPIGTIVSITDMMLTSSFDKEEQERWLGIMKRLGLKTLSSLELLMGLRRMEQGIFVPGLSTFPLGELVENTLAMEADIEFRSKRLKMYIQLNGDPIDAKCPQKIQADRSYVMYMLDNLLKNAIEASPERTPIHVDFISSEGKLDICIRNKGEVPEEIRDNLFGKYVTQGKRKGTGLGTYIARLITEAHQGSISLDASEKGFTTICITLPQPVFESVP